ncbi:SRPBCC family protein [Roseivirga sp.]|uniref:SRPBCC family protein n=1 Tax=Roseivirga sp. TaxID=1964215 RepID=UPI003B519E75
MNRIQKALTSNALFSGISGLMILLLSGELNKLFETGSQPAFMMVGSGLLLFALFILSTTKTQNPVSALLIIVMDLMWVIASIYVLILNPFSVSPLGQYIIIAIGVMVLLMAINQIKALSLLDNINGQVKSISFNKEVNSSRPKAWKVISDIANYHKVASNIDGVQILSGEGKGMVRQCSHGKDHWTETCTSWIEEHEYSFLVDTAASDYPFPFSYLKGTWELHSTSPKKTRIEMTFEFQFRKKFQTWLIYPLMKNKFQKVGEDLLNSWMYQIENEV